MKTPLHHALRWLGLVAALWLAAHILGRQLAGADWTAVQIRWPWLAAAFAVNLLYVLLYARLWQRLAESAGLALPPREAWGVYLYSVAGKYLPLRFAGLGYRLWSYHRRGGWPLSKIAGTLYFETVLALASGVAVAAVLSPGAEWRAFGLTPAIWAVSGVVLAGLMFLPPLVPRLARLRPDWLWLQALAESGRTTGWFRFLWRYAGAWLLLGTGLLLTIGALGGTVSFASWIHACWSYAVAGLAGMIVIIAPAGLGVRDGALALALATAMPAPLAALCAVAARLLIALAELVGALAGGWLLHRTAASAGIPATTPPLPLTPDDVVRRGQCMACGFCTIAPPGGAPGRMVFDAARGHHVPQFDGPPPASFVCPGAAMDMPALAQAKHGGLPDDPMLGTVVRTRAAYAADPEVRRRAASGGVIPALLTQLFESGQIDCAYCVEPGTHPETAAGTIIRQARDLTRTAGSVYHPVNFGARLSELFAGTERFAFVGLPCEIAALEMLKQSRPDVAARHVLSIGLFCGGINTFPGIAYYLEGFGIAADDVASIAYREGDWPGRIKVRLRSRPEPVEVPRIRGNSRWKILRYVVAFQGYWMLPRCRLCPDQVADFADIAVGDPHLPRFRARGGAGFSAVLTRTARGEALVAAAVATGRLTEEALSREEVIASQGYTLDNRRHVTAYVRVARWLGLHPPALTVYPAWVRGHAPRHTIYAAVDLMKVAVPRHRLLRWGYLPWQIFEYLFLTFAPQLIWRRLTNLVRNR